MTVKTTGRAKAGVSSGRRKAGTDAGTPRGRGSATQAIYDTLRHEIIEMAIEPGEALDEVRLSQRFKMSRTPVREALVRLEAEGLVIAVSNRGSVVAPIDFARVPTYFDALTLMYRVTTRLAAQRRTEADLVEIRAHQEAFVVAVDDNDAFEMIAINRDFHVAIAKAGHNPYYVDFFRRLLDEGRRLLGLYYSSFNEKLPPRRQFHEQIIDAIVARDPDLAERLAEEHALGVIRQIQAFLAPGIGTEIAIDRRGKGLPLAALSETAPARRARKR